jgi:predicted unusual protein kinase regulating ubiquinone biosynthesis (AarF/ABC1/UbiB family)
VTLNDSPADSRQYRNIDKALATLVEAQETSGNARHRLVQRGMAELRRTIEEIVPSFLFRQVVRRWSDRIIITALRKVNWDNSLVDEIVDVYEELSTYIEGHTHPEESSGSPPEPSKLEDLARRVGDIIRRAKPERQIN